MELNGIGIRPQNYNTNLNENLRGSKSFMVLNPNGNRRKTDFDNRVNSGQELNIECVCSNPTGSNISVKVYGLSDGELITDQAMDSVINFKIELLPNDFQEQDM